MKKKILALILVASLVLSACTYSSEASAPFSNVRLVDETGVPYGVQREGNRPYVTAPSWEFLVAAGNITDHASSTVFGHNLDVDSGVTADVWHGGATGDISLIWVAPTADRIHDIVSEAPADNATGNGARTIRIFGLDDWDTLEISELITMNGTSTVATVNSYVIINHMEVVTSGATSINVEVITATARVDNTVTALIVAGEGSSQSTIRGIPSVQRVFIGRFYGNINKSGGATGSVDFTLLAAFDPENQLQNFSVMHTFGVMTSGTSAITVTYYTPKIVLGPAIIKVQVTSGANDMDVAAGYDMIKAPR